MPRRKEIKQRKASESVVLRMLSRYLKVADMWGFEGICNSYLERDESQREAATLIGGISGLYPWECQVSREIMSPANMPLAEHLLTRPGLTYLAKTTGTNGIDSLWLVASDPGPRFDEAANSIPCRGFFRSLRLQSGVANLRAIQLNSINPYTEE